MAEAQGEVRGSFQKTQLEDEDAAFDTFMGKRRATAFPLANPLQPAVNRFWGLFLMEQIPTIQYSFQRKGDRTVGYDSVCRVTCSPTCTG